MFILLYYGTAPLYLIKYRKYFSCLPYTHKSPSELVDSLVKADGEFQPKKITTQKRHT